MGRFKRHLLVLSVAGAFAAVFGAVQAQAAIPGQACADAYHVMPQPCDIEVEVVLWEGGSWYAGIKLGIGWVDFPEPVDPQRLPITVIDHGGDTVIVIVHWPNGEKSDPINVPREKLREHPDIEGEGEALVHTHYDDVDPGVATNGYDANGDGEEDDDSINPCTGEPYES